MRRLLPLVLLLVALGAPGGAEAARLRPCPDQPGFACGVLAVPRDRADRAGPQVYLAFAVQSSRAQRRKPVLVALTGGPGQSGADFGTSFADSLKPALRRYRLAVIDQRGTGDSGALDCPTLQRASGITTSTPLQVAACARRIGPRRAFYGTRDTVADLDALRVRLGQKQLALMGVSYGTFVAQQYARIHPTRTRALILDSVVGKTIDPFLLDTAEYQPLALRAQCADGACRGVTRDPVADVARVAAALRRHVIAGPAFDGRGSPRHAIYRYGDELANLLVAGDLNPYLQASLPGAFAAAAAGDPALLLRLQRIGAGGPTRLRELSVGLFYATTCADQTAPYLLTQPFGDRDAAITAALAGVDPSRYAPFEAASVLRASNALACSRWPQDRVVAPSAAPLPDVPAIVFGGRVDQRTPLENGKAVALEIPQAAVVFVDGTGHDVLDSDETGCARRALSQWVDDGVAGSPCRGESNAVKVFPVPPRSLAAVGAARGVAGTRGRAVTAVLRTVTDVRLTVLQRVYADLDARAGGLRGGSFVVRGLQSEDAPVIAELRGYAYVPGVRVTGRVRLRSGRAYGLVRVQAAGAAGVLRLRRDGGVTGRRGGRPVRYRAPSGRGARAAAADPARDAVVALPTRPEPRALGAAGRK